MNKKDCSWEQINKRTNITNILKMRLTQNQKFKKKKKKKKKKKGKEKI